MSAFSKAQLDIALPNLAPVHPHVVSGAVGEPVVVHPRGEARLDGTEERIPVAPLMDLRRLGVERLPDVEQGRALLEADLYRVHRRRCELLALGCDERDRLALVSHLVLRQ